MKNKLWPVLLLAALATSGCASGETPEEAYLSTLRESEAALEDVSDEDLVAVGKGACDMFRQRGFDEGFVSFIALAADANISASGAGRIAGAATGAYCPEYANEFE